MTYDRAHWEQLWAKTLREHRDKVATGRERSSATTTSHLLESSAVTAISTETCT